MTVASNKSELLEIRNLHLDLQSGSTCFRALNDISLTVHRDETVGLVGESGSGKSITALSIAQLIPSPPARYIEGQILFEGEDVLGMPNSKLRAIRGGKVSYIFQEPAASLNPVFQIGQQIRETLRLHQPSLNSNEEVIRLLSLVGIPAPESRIKNYPHEMSGGMQQRVMIAMALASKPDLLVADEPTTALDVTIQAEIINLLKELKRSLGMSMLIITHNLGLLSDLADKVAVMYCGQIIEFADTSEILRFPRHPYTKALLQSVPTLGQNASRLHTIEGTVPNPLDHPSGCRFHPRCPVAQEDCSSLEPGLEFSSSNHQVRCRYPLETD